MTSEKPRAGLNLLVITLAAVALVGVLSGVRPDIAERLHRVRELVPLSIQSAAHMTTAVTGFCLLSVLSGLYRRKHAAWAIAVSALGLSALAHLFKGLEWEQSLLSMVLLAWLVAHRNEFRARSDPPSVVQGLKLLGGWAVFLALYGTVGFLALDHHYGIQADVRTALSQTFATALPWVPEPLHPMTRFGRYFVGSVAWVGGLGLLAATLLVLRPILIRRPASEEEQARAREIVTAHGASSLAFFTLMPDKHYFFSEGGSVLAYGVKGRAAVVLGDPIGPAADFKAAVTSFQALCRSNDWTPAFLQVLPERAAAYREAGFELVAVGEEAVVDVQAFSLKGKKHASLRTALNRFDREGYTTRVYDPPLDDEVLAQLRAISDAWLEQQAGQEKGFTLGWFYDDYIRASRVMVVVSPEGRIEAFANLVPEYQRNELTIDLMRRLPDSGRGIMEALFVRLFELARDEGYATFSLGLSPLSGVGEEPEDPLPEKVLHFIYENADRFYNFAGLHRFKDKFAPEWSPRYLAYLPGTLPAVTQAVIRLGSGDDFLWRQSLESLQESLRKR